MHASASKHNTALNKSLRHPPITSSTIHPSIIHPCFHPSILCFFPSSSVPSVGPVQSESLVELRLSRLISKSCLFHLSKCLHSQLLYEEADKGCLLSTADRLSPPSPVWVLVCIYTPAQHMQNYVWEIIFVSLVWMFIYFYIYTVYIDLWDLYE